jgi:hypothetical protein
MEQEWDKVQTTFSVIVIIMTTLLTAQKDNEVSEESRVPPECDVPNGQELYDGQAATCNS